jgi:hypothetical protein
MTRSRYPSSIDNDVTLESVRNGASNIKADVFNSFKSAILAIEKTLGVNPQGNQLSLADRLNVSINPNGSLRPEAVVTTIIADRNAFLTGGGDISWSLIASALTWSNNLYLNFPGSSGVPTTVNASTAFLTQQGDVLYIEPSRTGADSVKTPQVSNLTNNSLNGQDIFILAVRDLDGNIVFRDGTVVAPETTTTLGSATATRVSYSNTVSNIEADNVQDALDILDGYADRVDRDRNLILTGNAYNIEFDSSTGELSWSGNFIFSMPNLPANLIIRDVDYSPITFPSDQSTALVKIEENQTSDYFGTLVVVDDVMLVAHDGYSTALATRSDDKVYLRNGQVIFNPTEPVALGEHSANHIRFDDSLVPFTASDVNDAITTSHTTLNNDIVSAQSNLTTLETASNQDRDMYMMGGGDFTWDGTQVTFTQTIRIYNPSIMGDALILIASSPITLSADRAIAYITINRSATSDYTATVTVAPDGTLPSGNNIVSIATRISSSKVILKNGQVLFSGDQALEHGEVDSSRVTFDPSGTSLSSTDIQSALEELDTIISGLGAGLASGTLIMYNGASCPAGTTAVGGVSGAYPKFGAAASLTPTGSNSHTHGSHTHTATTNSGGSHSHSLQNHDFLDMSNIGFGGGLAFDAWQIGDNNLGNFSTQSAGSHSHSLTTDGATGPAATHEPINITVLLCEVT